MTYSKPLSTLLALTILLLNLSSPAFATYPPKNAMPRESDSSSAGEKTSSRKTIRNPYSVSLWLASESPLLVPGIKYSVEQTMSRQSAFYVQETLDWPYDYTSRDIGDEIESLEGQLILKVNLLDVVDSSTGGVTIGSLISEFTGSNLNQLKSGMTSITSRQMSTRLSIEIEVYDATNGRQVASIQQEAESKGAAFDLTMEDASYTGTKSASSVVGFDSASYVESGFGKAMKSAIAKGMVDIIKKLDERPWECQIAEVDENTVYLNVGEKSQLKTGDKLSVYRATKTLKHPKSGRVLQILKEEIGELTVTQVLEEITVARTVPGATFRTSDYVRLKKTK